MGQSALARASRAGGGTSAAVPQWDSCKSCSDAHPFWRSEPPVLGGNQFVLFVFGAFQDDILYTSPRHDGRGGRGSPGEQAAATCVGIPDIFEDVPGEDFGSGHHQGRSLQWDSCKSFFCANPCNPSCQAGWEGDHVPISPLQTPQASRLYGGPLLVKG